MSKVVSGPLMNLVGRGAPYGATGQYGPLCSAGVDPLYPLPNAYDGRSAVPFRLSAITTGVYVSFPNNLVPNGDFEQGTTGWLSSGATLTSETGETNIYRGVKSGKIVPTVSGGGILRTVIAQAGEYLQLRAAAKVASVGSLYVYILNLATHKYLQTDGTWGAANPAMICTATTMAAMTPVAFRIDDYATSGGPTVPLQVLVTGSDVATFYVDEVLIVPGFNFVSAVGHGFPASSGLVVLGSGGYYWHAPSFSAQIVGAPENLALGKQSAHAIAATMQYEPFPAVAFYPAASWGTVATNQIPWVGEVVVGQAVDLLQGPGYPIGVEYQEPNVRYRTSGGSEWVMPRGSHPTRRVTLPFGYITEADYQQARDLLHGMSRGGAYPLVLIPTETDPGEAIYGRLEDSTTFRREGFSSRAAEFIVQEEALPWF